MCPKGSHLILFQVLFQLPLCRVAFCPSHVSTLPPPPVVWRQVGLAPASWLWFGLFSQHFTFSFPRELLHSAVWFQ